MTIHKSRAPEDLENWHEDELIIIELRQGSQSLRNLWNRVHHRQQDKLNQFGAKAHRVSNFRKRVGIMKNRNLISGDNSDLSLSAIGEWVASSSLMTLERRISHLDSWLCSSCTDGNQATVLAPLEETFNQSRAGVFVSGICSNCQQQYDRLRTPGEIRTSNHFLSFHSSFIKDLKIYVAVAT